MDLRTCTKIRIALSEALTCRGDRDSVMYDRGLMAAKRIITEMYLEEVNNDKDQGTQGMGYFQGEQCR